MQKSPPLTEKPLRVPVQDIYKFTEDGDDRRIFAGRIESGRVEVGDEVIFLPSSKRSRIATIEGFNTPPQRTAQAGCSTGFTLETQVYVRPGELMCKVGAETAQIASQIRVNIFWLGRYAMIAGKKYKIKLGSVTVPVWLRRIDALLDASELTTVANRDQIERHDLAECVLETLKPVGFDLARTIFPTGRFVIIDNYDIAGCGVILEVSEQAVDRIDEHVQQRQVGWDRSSITPAMRASRQNQRSTLVIICGRRSTDLAGLAKKLEEDLFASGRLVYYLGLSNSLLGIDSDIGQVGERDEYLRRLGEISYIFTDAGMILITTISDLEEHELDMIERLNQPNDCLVVSLGESGDEISFTGRRSDLEMPADTDAAVVVSDIKRLLAKKNYLLEYYL